MDSRLLDRGEKNWDKLPEQYVIFFIEKDIFGDDEPIYHIESVIPVKKILDLMMVDTLSMSIVSI